MTERKAFEGWAIVELMGHRRVGAYVTEDTIAGMGFLRLEVPGATADAPNLATQFVAPSSVYCLTPTTEDLARGVAQLWKPQPVTSWELPKPEDFVRTSPEPDGDLVCDGCGKTSPSVRHRGLDEFLCHECAGAAAGPTS